MQPQRRRDTETDAETDAEKKRMGGGSLVTRASRPCSHRQHGRDARVTLKASPPVPLLCVSASRRSPSSYTAERPGQQPVEMVYALLAGRRVAAAIIQA